MPRLLALLCLFAASAARADYEVIGFSKDDAYVALVEHGTGEGNGAPWARLTILDTAKNAAVGKPVYVELGEGTEQAAAAQAVQDAGPELERLGVREPARSSRVDDEDGFGGEGWEEGGVVQVETRAAKRVPHGARCASPFKPLLLRVSMSQPDAEPVALLTEKTVPKDRPCTSVCRPEQVFAHGKAALVVARCGTPGFEGAAAKLVLVAARLPRSLLLP